MICSEPDILDSTTAKAGSRVVQSGGQETVNNQNSSFNNQRMINS
jgi:hypothetical protein